MNYTCDVCGGETFQDLGKLGNLRYLRCRSCGANCCYGTREPEEPVEIFTSRKIEVDTNYGAW